MEGRFHLQTLFLKFSLKKEKLDMSQEPDEGCNLYLISVECAKIFMSVGEKDLNIFDESFGRPLSAPLPPKPGDALIPVDLLPSVILSVVEASEIYFVNVKCCIILTTTFWGVTFTLYCNASHSMKTVWGYLIPAAG